jgi:putative ABC transport system permease protein
MLQSLLEDMRFASRSLRSSPFIVATTVFSLSIGIAAVTAVFSLGNALLLREPTWLRDPAQLVTIYTSEEAASPYGTNSYPDYLSLGELTSGLEGATAFRSGFLKLSYSGDRITRLAVELVDGNYFDVMGISPLRGRTFAANETRRGAAHRVLVLSHHLWTDRFASDPDVLGKTVELEGSSWTIIGLAPRGIVSRYLGTCVDAWLPLGTPAGVYRATPRRLADRTARDFMVVGRLRQGTSLDDLSVELEAIGSVELEAIGSNLAAEYGPEWLDDRRVARRLSVLSEQDSRLLPGMRIIVAVLTGFLFASTGGLLLIACSNVATLFLASVKAMALRPASTSPRSST